MKSTIAFVLTAAALLGTGNLMAAEGDKTTFTLVPNAQFAACFADPAALNPPSAHVTVVRGKLNDTLVLSTENMKPNLGFDLFTVQFSPFNADGTKDPNFKNFGLAWYQSDVEVGSKGRASVTIQTILLDQIFGFDPNHALPPTNTFHVGIWFNNPQDAAPCGFDVTKPTPFNGEHQAGPFAMISAPTESKLGPLCLNPQTINGVTSCKP